MSDPHRKSAETFGDLIEQRGLMVEAIPVSTEAIDDQNVSGVIYRITKSSCVSA